MIACVAMVANIVAKYRVLPPYCHKALVYQMFLTGTKERFRNVRLEMAHINAAAAYQRVYSYFKSLNMICCCPIRSLNRSGFFNGKLFHAFCNVLRQGSEGDLLCHFQTAGRLPLFEKARRICQTALDLQGSGPTTFEPTVEQEHPKGTPNVEADDVLATRADLSAKCTALVTDSLALSVGCRAGSITDVGVHLLGRRLDGADGEQEQAAAGHEYAAESCVQWFSSDANEVGRWTGSTVVKPCCRIQPQQLNNAALENVVACAPYSSDEMRRQLQGLFTLAECSKQDAVYFVQQRFEEWLKKVQSST